MDMAEAIVVQVLLFARFAELVGSERVEVRVAAPATVRDVVTQVSQLMGDGGLGVRPLVARNLSQVSLDAPVTADDELALLPPLAGG